MTIQDMLPYVVALNSALLIISMIATWLKGGSKELAQRVEQSEKKLETRIGLMEQRADTLGAAWSARAQIAEQKLAILERAIEAMPTKDLTHKLELSLMRLEGRLENMDERLKPVAAMAARMQDWVIEKADR